MISFKNALKISKKDPDLIQKGIYLWTSTYVQHKRQISSIVNEKIMIQCCNFHTLGGGISLVMALGNRSTCLKHFFHPCSLATGIYIII